MQRGAILRIVIFANGRMDWPFEIQNDDFIIAADGGARHCLERQIRPDIVIGDMDSLSASDIARLETDGAEIITFPARKDFTDLELALRKAQELDASEVLLLGALGARWDQTIANLILPSAYATMCIRLLDGPQEISFLRGGEELEVAGQPGDTVSLIPLAGDATGVATQNLEYPLNGDRLVFGGSRGVSNVLTAESAKVSLQEGLLLCVVIHH
jgi:thiamine pyrophosphokinase